MQLDVESRPAKTSCGRQAVISVHEQKPSFGVEDDHSGQAIELLRVLHDSRRIKMLVRIDRTAGQQRGDGEFGRDQGAYQPAHRSGDRVTPAGLGTTPVGWRSMRTLIPALGGTTKFRYARSVGKSE
jgi:hypothetical protein